MRKQWDINNLTQLFPNHTHAMHCLNQKGEEFYGKQRGLPKQGGLDGKKYITDQRKTTTKRTKKPLQTAQGPVTVWVGTGRKKGSSRRCDSFISVDD
jgi:hypothetical protein